MPDERLARTRRSLPSGYQFGDGGQDVYPTLPSIRGYQSDALKRNLLREMEPSFRCLLERWNVIEGDHA